MTEINRYENGKIYMIESASAGLCYYGSTCMPLHKRLYQHSTDHRRFKLGKRHCVTSFEVLDYDDHKIVLVEEFPCENKQQLVAREAHYIRTHECVNKCIPNRTKKQYREDNRDTIKSKLEQYRKDNKEYISEQKKQTMVCVCGSIFRTNDKSRHERTIKHQSFLNAQQQQ
jgi:hypothetical protein